MFLTGWDGLLGSALVPALRLGGHRVEGFGVGDADILDTEYLRGRLERFRPDWVVHLAAMTAVDRAESEPEEADRVNARGSRTVAGEAHRAGAALLALSTDYVFDGAKRIPYREKDPPAPLGVYGRTKLAAEDAVRGEGGEWMVVRSAWLFGPGGANFVDTILSRLERGEPTRVVNDQRGSPTYAPDLAAGLVRLMDTGARGVLHLVNAGDATWYELARAAARLAGIPESRVLPAGTAEIGRPAPRPAYSVLDATLAGERHGIRLRPWTEALGHFVAARRARAAGEAR